MNKNVLQSWALLTILHFVSGNPVNFDVFDWFFWVLGLVSIYFLGKKD